MRRNIVIDDALMREALDSSGARTKREAVELGVQRSTEPLTVGGFRPG